MTNQRLKAQDNAVLNILDPKQQQYYHWTDLTEKRYSFNIQEKELIENTMMGQVNYSRKGSLHSAEITELQRHDEAAPGWIK